MACLIILTRGDICKYSRIIYLIIICKYSGIIYLIVIILKESLQKSYFPPATSGIWMSQFVSKKIHNVQVFCNENLDFARPPSPLEKRNSFIRHYSEHCWGQEWSIWTTNKSSKCKVSAFPKMEMTKMNEDASDEKDGNGLKLLQTGLKV